MKKYLIFIAIIGAVAGFLAWNGVCYAEVYCPEPSWTCEASDNFDIATDGGFSQYDAPLSPNFYWIAYVDGHTGGGLGAGHWANSNPIDLAAFGCFEDGAYHVIVWQEAVPPPIMYSYPNLQCIGGVFGLQIFPPTITITSPATGTTITSTTTDLVGEWSDIDPDIYHNITLYFNSNFIGEQSVAKIIPVDDWTGNFTIPLSYFGISANGQWDLKGNATYANTQLSDMYITTDLISPAGYNLIFNVDGFHTPYTFTDFDTWYDTNVSNYETPSAWASGMIGYLQPILEKIAEFGARLQDYLDTSTAWQRGNDIGSVFPVVNAYILKINIFFGGFPIAQFFQWGILIMIGMFAIKIILKLLSFIPIIGGGG